MKMKIINDRSILTFVQSFMFLSFQISFASAAVACARREGISGLDPSSVTTAPKCLNLLTVSSACSLTVMSFVTPSALLRAMIFFLFSVLISIPYAFEVLTRCFIKVFRSVFVPVWLSKSSANRGLAMILPLILTVPSRSPSASDIILSRRCWRG